MIDSSESLSEREIEILRLVATGVSNKEIASALSISPNTVKVHLRNIFTKIDVLSRTEATLYAIKNGIVAQPGGGNGFSSLENFVSADSTNPLDLAGVHSAENETPRRLPLRAVLLWALIVVIVLVSAIFISNGVFPNTPTVPTPDSAPSSAAPRWQEDRTLPEARAGMGAVAYDNQIYLVGGNTTTGVSNDLLVFDISGNEWKELPGKPTPVSGIKAALIGEKIYVPGGKKADGNPTNHLEVFDPRQNTWEQRASMPESLNDYALAAYEGNLYVFGGWNGKQFSDRIYRYDPEQDQWETRELLPGARANSSAAALDGRILLLGGRNEREALNEVWIYYPDRDAEGDSAWVKGPDLPDARYGFAATTLANSVFILGGQASENDESTHPPLVLPPDAESWQTIGKPAFPVGGQIALLASGNFLHVLGGSMNGQLANEHLVYQALYTVSIPLISNEGGEATPP